MAGAPMEPLPVLLAGMGLWPRGLNQRRCSMCDFDGPDWMDLALAGALAEEMAEEEKELER